MKLLLLFVLATPAYALSEGGFHPEPCPTQLNSQVVVPITIKSNETSMNWKEIALQMETDPRVRKVLLEKLSKKLTDAWMLQAMKFKYRRFEK